jgi:hypothetical protein
MHLRRACATVYTAATALPTPTPAAGLPASSTPAFSDCAGCVADAVVAAVRGHGGCAVQVWLMSPGRAHVGRRGQRAGWRGGKGSSVPPVSGVEHSDWLDGLVFFCGVWV